jgi:hypothetical protein
MEKNNSQIHPNCSTAIQVAKGHLLILFNGDFLQTSDIFLERDGQAYIL